MASFKIKDIKSFIRALRKYLSDGGKISIIFVCVIVIAVLAGVDPHEALVLFGVLEP